METLQFVRQVENGSYFLIIQGDGDLILYTSNHFVPQHALWSSKTNGKGTAPYRLVMQDDDNLVVYDTWNAPTWASYTCKKGTRGHYLIIQDDRNAVVYDGSGVPRWSSRTNIRV